MNTNNRPVPATRNPKTGQFTKATPKARPPLGGPRPADRARNVPLKRGAR